MLLRDSPRLRPIKEIIMIIIRGEIRGIYLGKRNASLLDTVTHFNRDRLLQGNKNTFNFFPKKEKKKNTTKGKSLMAMHLCCCPIPESFQVSDHWIQLVAIGAEAIYQLITPGRYSHLKFVRHRSSIVAWYHPPLSPFHTLRLSSLILAFTSWSWWTSDITSVQPSPLTAKSPEGGFGRKMSQVFIARICVNFRWSLRHGINWLVTRTVRCRYDG